MRTWNLRTALEAASLVVLTALLVGCDITLGVPQFSVKEVKQFSVSGTPQVELATFDGSIEVRGWDKPDVLVEVEKRGADQASVDRIQVKATQSGNTITVEIPKPATGTHLVFGQTPSARLVVSVPTQCTLRAESGDGSVTIKRVSGRINIRTGDGRVHVSEAKGDLTVHTGDGSIQATEIDGHADVETHDGSITIDGVLQSVHADSGDGSVAITARKGSAMDADWAVTTGDGAIHVRVPDGFGAQVDAESGDGSVRIDNLGGQSDEHAGKGKRDRSSARGTIGAGGRLLKLRSGAGSISLKTS